jgi:dTDP-glucose 4,6-dehydratase
MRVLVKRVRSDRPGHTSAMQRLETDLGWRAAEIFETVIKETVRWFLERADWRKPLRDNIDRGERLGF